MECNHSLEMILEQVHELDFADFNNTEPHRFSMRNRMRINKLFSKYRITAYHRSSEVKRFNRRFAVAFTIIVILAAMSVTAVAVMLIKGFIQKEHHDNVQLFAENIGNSPRTIEEVYCLPELPQNYVLYDGGITAESATSIYINNENGCTLMLRQTVKSEFDYHYNNEGFELEAIGVNGFDGVFIDLSDDIQNSSLIIWDNGDYIIELLCDLSKNDTLNLAENLNIIK